jgi:hypothetical protein
MAKAAAGNEYKMLFIKKNKPELHEKVVAGQMSLTDAYNEAKRVQLGLSEYRGTSTKKKEFGVDFKRMMSLHDPTPEELIAEIKKAFPLTWKTFIKEI